MNTRPLRWLRSWLFWRRERTRLADTDLARIDDLRDLIQEDRNR